MADPLPFAEALVVAWLKSHALVTAQVAGRVYARKIPSAPVWPLLFVRRIGGIPAVPSRLDRPRLQIESGADDQIAAFDAAAAAYAAMHEITGFVHAEGVAGRVTDDLGLTWQPDPTTDRPRYLFGLKVVTHQGAA